MCAAKMDSDAHAVKMDSLKLILHKLKGQGSKTWNSDLMDGLLDHSKPEIKPCSVFLEKLNMPDFLVEAFSSAASAAHTLSARRKRTQSVGAQKQDAKNPLIIRRARSASRLRSMVTRSMSVPERRCVGCCKSIKGSSCSECDRSRPRYKLGRYYVPGEQLISERTKSLPSDEVYIAKRRGRSRKSATYSSDTRMRHEESDSEYSVRIQIPVKNPVRSRRSVSVHYPAEYATKKQGRRPKSASGRNPVSHSLSDLQMMRSTSDLRAKARRGASVPRNVGKSDSETVGGVISSVSEKSKTRRRAKSVSSREYPFLQKHVGERVSMSSYSPEKLVQNKRGRPPKHGTSSLSKQDIKRRHSVSSYSTSKPKQSSSYIGPHRNISRDETQKERFYEGMKRSKSVGLELSSEKRREGSLGPHNTVTSGRFLRKRCAPRKCLFCVGNECYEERRKAPSPKKKKSTDVNSRQENRPADYLSGSDRSESYFERRREGSVDSHSTAFSRRSLREKSADKGACAQKRSFCAENNLHKRKGTSGSRKKKKSIDVYSRQENRPTDYLSGSDRSESYFERQREGSVDSHSTAFSRRSLREKSADKGACAQKRSFYAENNLQKRKGTSGSRKRKESTDVDSPERNSPRKNVTGKTYSEMDYCSDGSESYSPPHTASLRRSSRVRTRGKSICAHKCLFCVDNKLHSGERHSGTLPSFGRSIIGSLVDVQEKFKKDRMLCVSLAEQYGDGLLDQIPVVLLENLKDEVETSGTKVIRKRRAKSLGNSKSVKGSEGSAKRRSLTSLPLSRFSGGDSRKFPEVLKERKEAHIAEGSRSLSTHLQKRRTANEIDGTRSELKDAVVVLEPLPSKKVDGRRKREKKEDVAESLQKETKKCRNMSSRKQEKIGDVGKASISFKTPRIVLERMSLDELNRTALPEGRLREQISLPRSGSGQVSTTIECCDEMNRNFTGTSASPARILEKTEAFVMQHSVDRKNEPQWSEVAYEVSEQASVSSGETAKVTGDSLEGCSAKEDMEKLMHSDDAEVTAESARLKEQHEEVENSTVSLQRDLEEMMLQECPRFGDDKISCPENTNPPLSEELSNNNFRTSSLSLNVVNDAQSEGFGEGCGDSAMEDMGKLIPLDYAEVTVGSSCLEEQCGGVGHSIASLQRDLDEVMHEESLDSVDDERSCPKIINPPVSQESSNNNQRTSSSSVNVFGDLQGEVCGNSAVEDMVKFIHSYDTNIIVESPCLEEQSGKMGNSTASLQRDLEEMMLQEYSQSEDEGRSCLEVTKPPQREEQSDNNLKISSSLNMVNDLQGEICGNSAIEDIVKFIHSYHDVDAESPCLEEQYGEGSGNTTASLLRDLGEMVLEESPRSGDYERTCPDITNPPLSDAHSNDNLGTSSLSLNVVTCPQGEVSGNSAKEHMEKLIPLDYGEVTVETSCLEEQYEDVGNSAAALLRVLDEVVLQESSQSGCDEGACPEITSPSLSELASNNLRASSSTLNVVSNLQGEVCGFCDSVPSNRANRRAENHKTGEYADPSVHGVCKVTEPEIGNFESKVRHLSNDVKLREKLFCGSNELSDNEPQWGEEQNHVSLQLKGSSGKLEHGNIHVSNSSSAEGGSVHSVVLSDRKRLLPVMPPSSHLPKVRKLLYDPSLYKTGKKSKDLESGLRKHSYKDNVPREIVKKCIYTSCGERKESYLKEAGIRLQRISPIESSIRSENCPMVESEEDILKRKQKEMFDALNLCSTQMMKTKALLPPKVKLLKDRLRGCDQKNYL